MKKITPSFDGIKPADYNTLTWFVNGAFSVGHVTFVTPFDAGIQVSASEKHYAKPGLIRVCTGCSPLRPPRSSHAS